MVQKPQWIDISGQRPGGKPRISVLSSGRLRFTVPAVRQLREAAGLADDEVLRIRIMRNPENTMLAVAADPNGRVVNSSGSHYASSAGVRAFFGDLHEAVHIDLKWDADQGMFIGEIPERHRPPR